MSMKDMVIGTLLAVIVLPVLGLGLWVLVVMLPVMAYTEAECLRNGYPKYAVSVGLERYCTTLDGSVRAVVDKAGEKAK